MAYEPTSWQSGDVITSAKLNKLEQGVAGNGGIVVNLTKQNYLFHADKTWREIENAAFAIFVYDDPSNSATVVDTAYYMPVRKLVTHGTGGDVYQLQIYSELSYPQQIYLKAYDPDEYPVEPDTGGEEELPK